MPFQSEKQRRYLHANHPEIAKRWEEEYATGGISNHFRKKFKKGSYSRSYNPGAGGVVQHGPVKTKTHHHGGNGGDGPPSVVHKPKGPTAAEIAAAKAAAEAKKKAEEEAKHKNWLHQKAKEKKKKVKHHSNIRPFGFTEYEKLIKPGLYDHYKKNLPSYDSEGVELRTERVLDNLDILKNIKRGGIKGNIDETISPFGSTFYTEGIDKINPYKPTQENFWEGHNTLVTPAGLNQAQTDYLDKVAKKGVVKESGQFFTYDKPTDVRAKLKELDEKSEEWIGTDVNPDKIVSGDPTTYATDKDVKEYLQKKYPGMQLKDEEGRTLAIDLATGGIANHFKFKDGGTPRQRFWWGGNPNEDRAAEESHANEFAGIDSGGWDPGVASPGTTSSGGNVNTGGDQEDDVAQMMHNMGITPDHSPDYTGSDAGWVVSEDEETEIGGSDYIGPKDKVRIHNEILNRKTTWDKNKWKRDVTTLMSLPTNPFSFVSFVYNQNKKKNERIAEIDADLELLDKIGATKYTPHTDTLYQKLEQEKLDLTQPRSRDEDTGGDGPTPLVVPAVMDEMASATGEIDMFDAWDRIKRNQAIFAARQSADDTKVGEWVGDQRLLVNSGGLANLFRVKNRN